MTTFISINHGAGAESWRQSVPAVGSLPATGALGDVRLDRTTGGFYYWNGSAWAPTTAALGSTKITDLTAETGGAVAAAGEIGEIITAEQAAATATGVGATGVWGNAISIVLTAGVWEIIGVAGFKENTGVLDTALQAAISDSSSGVGLSALDSAVLPYLISATSDAVSPVPPKLVNITIGTTYYLNTKFSYTAGQPQHYGRLTARRIR